MDGIFTPNESSTAGMLLALQDIGKAGTITFVGFDYSSGFIAPLEKGELKGFVVQNPVNMGYLSVKTMVEHLQGKPVPPTVDTGVMMVTLDNLHAPDVQAVMQILGDRAWCWSRGLSVSRAGLELPVRPSAVVQKCFRRNAGGRRCESAPGACWCALLERARRSRGWSCPAASPWPPGTGPRIASASSSCIASCHSPGRAALTC